MVEAPSHLIMLPGGATRVLRLVAGAQTDALRYSVPPDMAMCIQCGCTERYACYGGCAWVTPARDLCSRCLKKGMLL